MNFKEDSGWNIITELKCLLILKKLEANNFQRGLQIELSKELSKDSNLSEGSISAKVSNYKSVAQINNSSNASLATKELYEKYKNYNIAELEELIAKLEGKT